MTSFFGPAGVAAFDRRHGFQFLEPLDGLLHRQHVGEQAAQPALVDVVHLAAGGFFGDGFLRLALGADEEHVLALRGHLAHEPRGVLEHLQGLLQVDDVDSVAFAEDVFFHLRIPALGLVPEVNAGFEQFLHRYCGQTTSSIDLAGERLARLTEPRRAAARSKARFARADGSRSLQRGAPGCTQPQHSP